MQSIVLEQPGLFRLRRDAPEPAPPRSGEAVVRVRRAGVCGTDFHAFRGRQPFFTYPRVPGHELAVEVISVGADAGGFAPGNRCCVEPYLECGACIACRRGRTNCCANLRVLGVHVDGGMCERMNVPLVKLHKSAMLSLDQLAFVETLCIGAHAVARGQPESQEPALVIGAGPIGMTVMQFLKLAGAHVTALDLNGQRLESCRDQRLADRIVQLADLNSDPLDALRRATGEELPTLVFDATGSARSMTAAFRLVAHSGRLVLVGLCPDAIPFDDPDFHRRELTVLASRNATAADFARVIKLIEQRRIDPTPWITHRATGEDDLTSCFNTWLAAGSGLVKAVIEL